MKKAKISKKRRKSACRRRRIIFGIIFLLLIALGIWIYSDNHSVDVSRISVKGAPSGFDGYKIAQISDLHNAEFGTDNSELVNILKQESPNIIVFTGDLLDARHTDYDVAENFLRQCTEIADCYFVTGNHEAKLGDGYKSFEGKMIALGVTVLRNGSVRIRSGIDAIRLIGVEDPSFIDAKSVDDSLNATLETLTADDYTILLAHRPEKIEQYAEWNIQLVLSGHAHGGQVRLPWIGGLYAPGQGFLPKYTSGLYTVNETQMIVSRGLGNSAFPFRINNRPEVVIVTLEK